MTCVFPTHTHKKHVHNLSFKQHDQDSPEVALLQSDSENHRLWSFKIDFLVAEKDPRNSHPVGITTMTISTVQIFCWNSQIPSDGIGIYIYMYTDPVVYKYSRRWQKKVGRVQLKLFAGLRVHVLSCLPKINWLISVNIFPDNQTNQCSAILGNDSK